MHKITNAQKGRYGEQLTKQVIEKSKGHCYYCGVIVNPTTSREDLPDDYYDKMLTMEHLIPKSNGGKTELNNLVIACKKCNNHKSNGGKDFLRMRLLFAREGWPKFSLTQFTFLVAKGFSLQLLKEFKFYHEGEENND